MTLHFPQPTDRYERLHRPFTCTNLINSVAEGAAFPPFKQFVTLKAIHCHHARSHQTDIPRQIHGRSTNFLQLAPWPLPWLIILGNLTTLIQLYRFMVSNVTKTTDNELETTRMERPYALFSKTTRDVQLELSLLGKGIETGVSGTLYKRVKQTLMWLPRKFSFPI
jgi:hypothetical protein